MLSHPGSSQASQLLAHVGAAAADVPPVDYPMPGKDLERYSAEIPADRPPKLTQAAELAIQIAASELQSGSASHGCVRFELADASSIVAYTGRTLSPVNSLQIPRGRIASIVRMPMPLCHRSATTLLAVHVFVKADDCRLSC
jgi:hypothetical protein